jgi:uncharacterized repeat protein (TIGR03943 family)
MRVDPRRALRLAVLVCWAGFFAYLWLSGEMTRYLGPRTYWVVVFGGVVLTLAAIGHLVTLRTAAPQAPTVGEVLGHLLLLAPIAAVLAVPQAELGALAAAKKSSGGGIVSVTSILPPEPKPGAPLSFIDIHFAERSQPYADAVGAAEGTGVTLTGFVSRLPGEAGTFELTRFYVSCCAADAIPYSVEVEASGLPASVALDDWLRVEGELAPGGDGFVVRPSSIEQVDTPKEPYLY